MWGRSLVGTQSPHGPGRQASSSLPSIRLLSTPLRLESWIKVVKAMIHDLTDLEPLLHQYDREKVLIGPLLNLWTNSSFRIFNIAGKSGKIHETIGLGFFELEIDAQRRRADIVAALEGCFGEVEIFDSQVEMAQMAHTLWANDETARFLATVLWESKPRPSRETSQNQNLAYPNKVTVLSGDRKSGDEEACMAVAPPDVIDLGPAHTSQSAGDQADPTRACDPTQISDPLYLRNLSDTDAFANPGTLAEPGSNLETVKNLPAAVAGSSVSKKYRLWALSGVAAYLALCCVVGFLIGTTVFTSFTGMRQTANEAILSRNAATSITAGNDPSQATGTVTHPIPAGSIGTANREAQLREAARVTSPSFLTSQPSVADGEADAAPFPGAQPSQKPSDQAPDEQLSQSPKAQGNQSDGSISLPQSSPPQTVKTQSSAAETAPLSIQEPPEVAPTQVFVSQASAQIMAGNDEPQLLPSDAATPKAPEALSTAQQRQASNLAIVPLPRPRPVVSAVSSELPRRRIGPLGE